MKKNIIAALSLSLLFFGVTGAEASWLIDPGKFYNSVHGDTSCQECHEAIGDLDLHPNPNHVNKSLSDFFSADTCNNCHDEVQDNLEEGFHCSETVDNPNAYQQCIECHNPHDQTAIGSEQMSDANAAPVAIPDEDKDCMVCHGIPKPETPQSTKAVSQLCFHCHAQTGTEIQKQTAKTLALIDPEAHQSTPHTDLNCLVCHPKAPGYRHNAQVSTDCRQCHLRHDEKVAHDAHMTVACQACHLQDIKSYKDADSGRVLWKSKRRLNATLRIHDMHSNDDQETCLRCHIRDNSVGAAAMILPAKSILCMPCHTATFSVGDATTVVTLILFVFGLFAMFSYVLTGTMTNTTGDGRGKKFFTLIENGIAAVFSPKFGIIIKTLILDVLLQRRLYRLSVSRWLAHSLIFLPFVFRFFWGLIALCGSLWSSESNSVWTMIDKNYPLTAFLFDLSGIMILTGIVLAFIRGARQTDRAPGLPRQDWIALSLIGGIVLIGFILEGMRIAMTGTPSGSTSAFIGYGFSSLFADNATITQSYGFIWYFHAVLAGAFVVYLPFSRMLHIIMAPVILSMNALRASEHKRT